MPNNKLLGKPRNLSLLLLNNKHTHCTDSLATMCRAVERPVGYRVFLRTVISIETVIIEFQSGTMGLAPNSGKELDGMQLEGKCAIVTGSTKGIGLSIAKALLDQGTKVVISSRHKADVRETVSNLADRGTGSVAGHTCDVQDPAQFQKLIDFCVEVFGGLDILINNAGIGRFKTVEELSIDEWRQTIATNLDSLFYGCSASIPEMKKRGGGFIINIGSLAGKNAFPKGAAYNASKFGLIGFSEALMQEVRHDDIQVAYIMPGSVDTWFGGRPPAGDESWKVAASDIAQIVVETLSRSSRCLTSRIEVRPPKPPRK